MTTRKRLGGVSVRGIRPSERKSFRAVSGSSHLAHGGRLLFSSYSSLFLASSAFALTVTSILPMLVCRRLGGRRIPLLAVEANLSRLLTMILLRRIQEHRRLEQRLGTGDWNSLTSDLEGNGFCRLADQSRRVRHSVAESLESFQSRRIGDGETVHRGLGCHCRYQRLQSYRSS
jgi:hypothetical protein